MIFKYPKFLYSSRPNCSDAWLRRQSNDMYVRLSRENNYRSRSAFKLLQIQERYQLIKPGYAILDCGAAPGGWSQIACEFNLPSIPLSKKLQSMVDSKRTDPILRPRGHDLSMAINKSFEVLNVKYPNDNTASICPGLVISVDLRPISLLEGAILLDSRDCFANDTLHTIKAILEGRKLDVILSDVLPNLTGQKDSDHDISINHAEKLFKLIEEVPLKKNGSILIKILMGKRVDGFKSSLEKIFKYVKVIKPNASRSESREIFLLGLSKKNQ